MIKFDFAKILGNDDTLEEWLTGFVNFHESHKRDSGTVRMERKEYYETYFPKGFDYVAVYNQLQKIKAELREKGVLKMSCENHIGAEKYYDSKYGLNCPRCKKETNINTKENNT